MPRTDWALLCALEGGTIVVILLLVGQWMRRALRSIRAAPDELPKIRLRLVEVATTLPMLAWIVPFVLWFERGGGSLARAWAGDGAAAATWAFAVAWTGYVVAWTGCVAIGYAADRMVELERRGLCAHIALHWRHAANALLVPLLAAWGTALWTASDPPPVNGPDPTPALCWLLAWLVTTNVVSRFGASPLRDASDVAKDVSDSVFAIAGEGERVRIVVARLRDAGLPAAFAWRHRRQELIAIDEGLLRTLSADERTATLLHELGHHRLGHIRRRAWMTKSGLLGLVLVPTVFGAGHIVVFYVASFALTRWVELPLWRTMEFEADLFAAERAGARTTGAALFGMHRSHGLPDDFGRLRGSMTHPDLIRRLAVLGLTTADFAPVA